MLKIRSYVSKDGADPFVLWTRNLRDTKARVAIDRRLTRVAMENFGDHKFCTDGVWELRIDVGAGYRVYYAFEAQEVVLLLGGGDKSSQSADIRRAVARLYDWRKRQDERQKL